jgi:hypothetical protein
MDKELAVFREGAEDHARGGRAPLDFRQPKPGDSPDFTVSCHDILNPAGAAFEQAIRPNPGDSIAHAVLGPVRLREVDVGKAEPLGKERASQWGRP